MGCELTRAPKGARASCLLWGQAVMMCLLGGMGAFFGPFVGAGLYLTLEDVVTTFSTH